ncbi:MAG: hypothetical protein ACPGFB_08125 [Verrucomicrobiales bacterium]
MKLTPGQSLAILVLIGIAVAGWLYGIHWKKIASGDAFSQDEKLLIELQEQIRTLSEKNTALVKQVNELQKEAVVEDVEGSEAPAAELEAPPAR